jgi:hypothetical protein
VDVVLWRRQVALLAEPYYKGSASAVPEVGLSLTEILSPRRSFLQARSCAAKITVKTGSALKRLGRQLDA